MAVIRQLVEDLTAGRRKSPAQPPVAGPTGTGGAISRVTPVTGSITPGASVPSPSPVSVGSGSNSSGLYAQDEEKRKEYLRQQINALYGIDTTMPLLPVQPPSTDIFGNRSGGPMEQVYRPGVESSNASTTTANADAAAQAAAAKASLEAESKSLAEATKAYYSDQLNRANEEAERQNRFALARRGLIGGSAAVDFNEKRMTDESLGATRVGESVDRALAGLNSGRERERLNAISLVNAGAGDSAVSAAQTGLRNAFDTENTRQRADITSDLFKNLADSYTMSRQNDLQSLLSARYRDSLRSFFPSSSGSTGRVTPG